MTNAAFAAARTQPPDALALVVGVREATWVTPAGEAETLTPDAAAMRIRRGETPIVCHARAVARRLRLPAMAAFDVLELFAFVRPARFCVPTPRGLATALLLPPPEGHDAEAASLLAATRALLGELTASPGRDAAVARAVQ